MPNNFEEDDRPRPPRKPPSIPPRMSSRPAEYDDEDFEDRERSRGGEKPREKKSPLLIILGVLLGVLVVCSGGVAATIYFIFTGTKAIVQDMKKGVDAAIEKAEKESQEQKVIAIKSETNLRKIAIAFQNYELTFGEFPTNSFDSTGKPLLSWRVHLLPYLEQDELYKKFKLDEPWDSPTNRALLSQMPDVYAYDNNSERAKGMTHYRGFDGPQALFEKRYSPFLIPKNGIKQPAKVQVRKIDLASINDGLSNTILCVEARIPVEWTKPEELVFQRQTAIPTLGITPDQDYRILMLDGSIKTIPKFAKVENAIKDAITIAGGEVNTLP